MNRTVLMDGASGTRLWQLAEEAGIKKEPVWKYNNYHPELVKKVAAEYIAAGSELINTNTFSINRTALKKYPGYDLAEIVKSGVRIAKEAVKESGRDVKIALCFGPLTDLMEPYGDLEEDEVAEIYTELIEAGIAEDPDYIYLETFMDLGMQRVAAEAAAKFGKPILCSLSFEKRGKTIFGNSVKDAVDELTPIGVYAIGTNCSQGPDDLIPVLKEFSEYSTLPIIFKPNAGLPGKNPYDIPTFKAAMEQAVGVKGLGFIGACCGSDSRYIGAIKELL